MKAKKGQTILKGVPISRGVAIGKPFFFTLIEDSVPEFSISKNEVEAEIKRYSRAVKRAKDDIQRLQKKLEKEKILEGAAILDAHLQIMSDPIMTTKIEEDIRKTRKNAEYVFYCFIKEYQKKFQKIADPFFRERFKDIQDISRRVVGYLRQTIRVSLADIPENSIIFSQGISASDAAEANCSSIGAFVTENGGETSHAAIVAKAKCIPFVSNVNIKNIESDPDQLIIVDGRTGEVIINPSKAVLDQYECLKGQLSSHLKTLSINSKLIAKTSDGHHVKLSANIDSVHELEYLHEHGGHGVGLFRSEHIFMKDDAYPTEEEQFELYKEIVTRTKGLPIVIRTFDIGGDKMMVHQKVGHEINPFLGCRAIRFFLKEKELFKAQIRAILRASAFGNVRIMFPMITSYSEIVEAKKVVKEVKQELRAKRVKMAKSILLGCMIEVPSAAIIADLIAKECDFLSIGTNDLVQYALAVDRGNLAMSQMYTPTDPSVLRLIQHVVQVADDRGIPVSVCGEIAADPRFTPLLLGLGVHELSVASRHLPVIKNAIRRSKITDSKRLAKKALKLTKADLIQNLLIDTYKKAAPEDQFFNI